MSTLTKVFAVLLVVACIACSMSVTQFLVASSNERELKENSESKRLALHAVIQSTNVQNQRVGRLLNEERAARVADAVAADAEQKRQAMNNQLLSTQLATLVAKFSADQAANDSLIKITEQAQKLHQVLAKQVADLRNEASKQIQIATALRDDLRGRARVITGLEYRVGRLDKQGRDQAEEIKRLQTIIRDNRTRTAMGNIGARTTGTTTGGEVRPDITKPLHGRVKSVSNDLAEISLGEDDGVATGMRFLVYRGDKLLAIFVADKVEPDSTAGRLLDVKATIKGGDNVLANPRLF